MGSRPLRNLFAERRKKQLERALEPATSAAQAAAKAAEQAAQSADAAARDARMSAALLTEALNRATQYDRTEVNPRRFLILLALSLLFLASAVIAGGFVPTAFTDPTGREVYPKAPGGGVLQVQVAHLPSPQSDAAAPGSSATVHIFAWYALDYSKSALYRIWFPKRLIGDRFALILSSHTQMQGVRSPDAALTIRAGHCDWDLPNGVPRHSRVPCQFVYGIVPGTATQDLAECSIENEDPSNYTPVTITGESARTGNLDWAHHVTTLPAV